MQPQYGRVTSEESTFRLMDYILEIEYVCSFWWELPRSCFLSRREIRAPSKKLFEMGDVEAQILRNFPINLEIAYLGRHLFKSVPPKLFKWGSIKTFWPLRAPIGFQLDSIYDEHLESKADLLETSKLTQTSTFWESITTGKHRHILQLWECFKWIKFSHNISTIYADTHTRTYVHSLHLHIFSPYDSFDGISSAQFAKQAKFSDLEIFL